MRRSATASAKVAGRLKKRGSPRKKGEEKVRKSLAQMTYSARNRAKLRKSQSDPSSTDDRQTTVRPTAAREGNGRKSNEGKKVPREEYG